MLHCDKTVTLTHRTFDPDTGGDREIVTELRGVHWYAQHKAAADNGLRAALSVKCRIPPGALEDAPLPVPGDTLTCGAVAVTVVDVHDNRGGAIGHVYVEGQG